MPTKRTRRGRGNAVPKEVLMLLGLGMGMNRYPEDELRELWREYGERVTAYWQTKYGKEPFAASIAEQERWL